jgi:hypothetical protein
LKKAGVQFLEINKRENVILYMNTWAELLEEVKT